MRKRISSQPQRESPSANTGWLDLEALARVEVTSEDAAHPIESALLTIGATGWRAQSPGEQTIRLLFEAPQRLRRIRLLFREDKEARTQEFVLRWSPTADGPSRDIVRWTVCRWRPAQDELLRARLLVFSKQQADAPKPLRRFEEEADRLFSWAFRAPSCCANRQQR